MHRFSNQLTVTAVALVLGLLVVVQLRSQATAPGLAGLSAQELTVLVANLNTRNDQLRTEVASLQAELDALKSAQARGETSVDQIRSDLDRTQVWAGLVAATGPGVTINVAGPISAGGVEELMNELRNAGAEAISIGGVRAVASSVVTGTNGALAVDAVALTSPFEIDAIGSSQTLTGSLTRPGGVVAQLAATDPSTVVTVTPVDRVAVPATKKSLVPSHGSPHL